jgi:predicted nucleotidyltransferase
MDTERILGILRQHEPEFKATGIQHLRLFGSAARGESTPQSDVDLLFDCDSSDTSSLLRIYGSQDEFAELLGVQVHLSSEKYMRPEIRDRVLAETIDVF